jgi:hypothetical protein
MQIVFLYFREKKLKENKTKENYRCGEFYEYLLFLITYVF